MAFDESLKIWKNGKLVPWPEATLHVASHVVHYGSSVFEGIRCYATEKGSAIFRLEDHVRRLYNSAKIYRMEIPFSEKETVDACVQVVRSNGLKEAYVRPVAWRGYGALGVDPSACPVDLAVLAWKWGAYLGQEALENGVDVCVSTWRRPAPNTLPTLAKAGANYMNSQLIKMEAKANGFSEGIALTVNGQLSEGSGENLFVVAGGRLLTPPLSASILPGLTRDSVMILAADLGIEVSEEPLPREILAVADEAFFTGTAAEVTPIRSVDRIPVGKGKRGPVTAAIQSRFFDLIHGKSADSRSWLHFI